MKKILLALIIIIVLVLLIAYLMLDQITEKIIESQGTKALGTKVEIEAVDVGLSTGSIAINSLNVRNPKGFEKENLFSFEKVFVDVNEKTLFEDVIVVEEVNIDKPVIVYEMNNVGQINFIVIKNNIQVSEKENKTETSQSSDKKKKGKEKKFIIKSLKITAPEIIFSTNIIGNTHQEELKISDIHLKNIGNAEEAVTKEELLNVIVEELENKILKENSFMNKNIRKLDKKIDKLGDKLNEKLNNKLNDIF